MSQDYEFSWRAVIAGAHTHVDVWAGPEGRTRGNCGHLCFRNEEWLALDPTLRMAGHQVVTIDTDLDRATGGTCNSFLTGLRL